MDRFATQTTVRRTNTKMLKTFKEPKNIKIICGKCGCIKLTNDYLTREQHRKELEDLRMKIIKKIGFDINSLKESK